MYLRYSFIVNILGLVESQSPTMKPSSETPVGELVRAVPGRARLFEKFGIDFCCGGQQPLAQVCEARQLELGTLVSLLMALDSEPENVEFDPNPMSLAERCTHLVRAHHDSMRKELPRLDLLTRKMAGRHGDREPRLPELRGVFESYPTQVGDQLEAEKKKNFPASCRLEPARRDRADREEKWRRAVARPTSDSETTGAALKRFAGLTDHYTPSEWACSTFRVPGRWQGCMTASQYLPSAYSNLSVATVASMGTLPTVERHCLEGTEQPGRRHK